MAILKVNGINIGGVIATAEEPKREVRDIGNRSQATDGTTRMTLVARKRDLKFKSVLLSRVVAYVWDCLFSGEGETWSFDVNLYGSKGTGPTVASGALFSAGSAKFGAGKLALANGGTFSVPAAINTYGKTGEWAVMVFRSTDAGSTWTHYMVRSDGVKTVNGVRDDLATTTWLGVSGATVSLTNSSGSTVHYDDLVVLPYLALEDWPLQSMVSAFSSLPFVNLSGDMVQEVATRTVIGTVSDSSVRVAVGYMSKLDVQFEAR